MRCGCYALLLGLGLTFSGAQGTFEWFKNRSQTVTTYANFEKQKPTGGWFKISDARLEITQAMWTTGKFSDDKNEIYVPIIPLDEDKPGAKIHVLIEIDDAATKQLVDEVSKFDKSTSEDKVLEYVLKNRDKLYPTRPVSGMVKFGLNDIQSEKRQKIAALNPDLASDFVVLEENARPNVGISLLCFIGGILLTLFCLAGFLGGKSDDSAPQNSGESGTSAPAGPPPPPMAGGSAG